MNIYKKWHEKRKIKPAKPFLPTLWVSYKARRKNAVKTKINTK